MLDWFSISIDETSGQESSTLDNLNANFEALTGLSGKKLYVLQGGNITISPENEALVRHRLELRKHSREASEDIDFAVNGVLESLLKGYTPDTPPPESNNPSVLRN